MSGLTLDHVVIRVPDPDGLAARISEATGLPVLRGWTPGGERISRGVRFANGPFLDIFPAETAQPAPVGLAGSVDATRALAETHGWRLAGEEESLAFPWKLAAFRRKQGALSALFVIDYHREASAWADEEFSGELFDPAFSESGAARLAAVEIAGSEPRLADLEALGLRRDGAGFDLGNARLTVRPGASATAGAVVLDVELPTASAVAALQLTPDLVMRLSAATTGASRP